MIPDSSFCYTFQEKKFSRVSTAAVTHQINIHIYTPFRHNGRDGRGSSGHDEFRLSKGTG